MQSIKISDLEELALQGIGQMYLGISNLHKVDMRGARNIGQDYLESAASNFEWCAKTLRRRAAEQRDEARQGKSPLPKKSASDKPKPINRAAKGG